MQRAIQRGIERKVSTSNFLVNDGTNLQGPSVGREAGALVSKLCGKAEADWKMPFLRSGNAGADVAAHILKAETWIVTGKDVKSGLKPISETVGDLQSFMDCMVSGLGAFAGEPLPAAAREPSAVQLLCSSNMVECAARSSLL